MKIKIIILLITTFLIIFFAPYIGKKEVSSGVYKLYYSFSEPYQSNVIRDIRIPQTLMAFFVGAALSICGLMYQTLFHNDLASPFTLGVSSGAAFGATLAIKFSFLSFFYIPAAPAYAFIFGCLTVVLLIALPLLKKSFDTFTLLLTGVALNFFYAALTLLVSYLSNYSETFHIHRWLMGSIDEFGYSNILLLAGLSIFIIGFIYYYREDLNITMLSDETAQTRGVNIARLKILIMLVTSILLAFCVSLCGPIGFVGIICPHIAKLIFGHNHRITIPASVLFGGAFLCLCFTLARIIIFPFIVPVGIITSFLGGPFLIFLLMRNRSNI